MSQPVERHRAHVDVGVPQKGCEGLFDPAVPSARRRMVPKVSIRNRDWLRERSKSPLGSA
jgi:hypothetical protein